MGPPATTCQRSIRLLCLLALSVGVSVPAQSPFDAVPLDDGLVVATARRSQDRVVVQVFAADATQRRSLAAPLDPARSFLLDPDARGAPALLGSAPDGRPVRITWDAAGEPRSETLFDAAGFQGELFRTPAGILELRSTVDPPRVGVHALEVDGMRRLAVIEGAGAGHRQFIAAHLGGSAPDRIAFYALLDERQTVVCLERSGGTLHPLWRHPGTRDLEVDFRGSSMAFVPDRTGDGVADLLLAVPRSLVRDWLGGCVLLDGSTGAVAGLVSAPYDTGWWGGFGRAALPGPTPDSVLTADPEILPRILLVEDAFTARPRAYPLCLLCEHDVVCLRALLPAKGGCWVVGDDARRQTVVHRIRLGGAAEHGARPGSALRR